jgi:hypothetical protein
VWKWLSIRNFKNKRALLLQSDHVSTSMEKFLGIRVSPPVAVRLGEVLAHEATIEYVLAYTVACVKHTTP